MKVELNLSDAQLKSLDDDLSSLLDRLTDEQKTEIIKAYVVNNLDKMITYTDILGGYSSYSELSSFGKELVNGMRDLIRNSLTKEIMDSEELRKVLEPELEDIKERLPIIVDTAVTKYVAENLFMHKDDIADRIRSELWSMQRS